MFTYRKILAKAWEITRKNPVLWIFGLFVAFLGNGGEIEIISSSVTFGAGLGIARSLVTGIMAGTLFNSTGNGGILDTMRAQPAGLLLVILFAMAGLAIIVFFIWLINVSQAALIRGLIEKARPKKDGDLKNFSFGITKFWPVFFLNFLSKATMAVLFFVASLFALADFPGSFHSFLIVFVLSTSVIVLVSFIIRYAICAVVLKDQNFSEALKFGKELFFKNWLLSLEVALVLFAVYFLVNYIFAFFASLILFYAFSAFRLFFSAILLTVVLVVAAFAFVQAILSVFHWAVWALVFEIISSKNSLLSSKLISGFKRIFG